MELMSYYEETVRNFFLISMLTEFRKKRLFVTIGKIHGWTENGFQLKNFQQRYFYGVDHLLDLHRRILGEVGRREAPQMPSSWSLLPNPIGEKRNLIWNDDTKVYSHIRPGSILSSIDVLPCEINLRNCFWNREICFFVDICCCRTLLIFLANLTWNVENIELCGVAGAPAKLWGGGHCREATIHLPSYVLWTSEIIVFKGCIYLNCIGDIQGTVGVMMMIPSCRCRQYQWVRTVLPYYRTQW